MKVNPLYAAMAVAGIGVAYIVLKPGAAKKMGFGAINAASNVAVGAVEGIGSVLGIPQTNAQKCAAAQAAGNTYQASLFCPAKTFIAGVFGSTVSNEVLAAQESAAERFRRLERTGPVSDLDNLQTMYTPDGVGQVTYDQFGNIIG